MGARSGTRERMLVAAVELMRERGAGSVTVDAVLARSQTPRGSVYHHFPGGRAELVREALIRAGDTIGVIIEDAAGRGALGALRFFGEFWTAMLRASDFTAGCPVVSVAVGGGPDDDELGPVVAAIFDRWHAGLVATLTAEDIPRERAEPLATLAVAAMEGAVVLCRVHRSTAPLDAILAELEETFTARLARPLVGGHHPGGWSRNL
ncbi:TetR family transcriptional regulator [Nocardia mangyaensis]|uniref:TetR family transcriptional regulator n=1 Tax=Nocardia mangyaensis TaxID=2213200 RepID=A0A1J0VTF7_9NOCA|nr:TetR/AcrR family transcriptional regulator [Nocardia mangyaensis]APE35215.1 TetR family transcriptional regulator [Nocardia mangyaensis]